HRPSSDGPASQPPDRTRRRARGVSVLRANAPNTMVTSSELLQRAEAPGVRRTGASRAPARHAAPRTREARGERRAARDSSSIDTLERTHRAGKSMRFRRGSLRESRLVGTGRARAVEGGAHATGAWGYSALAAFSVTRFFGVATAATGNASP